MTHPVPTKGFLQLSPEAAMLPGPSLFSKPIRSKEERNGPPSSDQGLSTAKPRSGHVPGPSVETRPLPAVPPFLLAHNLSPKDIAGSDITG